MPALFWVFSFFMFFLFSLGTFFRIVFGPGDGQKLTALCGPGDEIDNSSPAECRQKLHHVYGEEFFGNVPKSMFTTFRWMLGDFSTLSGKSLAVAFSDGYGDVFHISYFVGMIVV